MSTRKLRSSKAKQRDHSDTIYEETEGNSDGTSSQAHDLDDDVSSSDEDEYEVEEILDSYLLRTGELCYRVKWVGYDDDDKTWYRADEGQFDHCPDLVAAFHKEYPIKPGSRASRARMEALSRGPFDFLGLPLEIRQLIYRAYFACDSGVVLPRTHLIDEYPSRSRWPLYYGEPEAMNGFIQGAKINYSLLLSCKLIFNEAQHAVFMENAWFVGNMPDLTSQFPARQSFPKIQIRQLIVLACASGWQRSPKDFLIRRRKELQFLASWSGESGQRLQSIAFLLPTRNAQYRGYMQILSHHGGAYAANLELEIFNSRKVERWQCLSAAFRQCQDLEWGCIRKTVLIQPQFLGEPDELATRVTLTERVSTYIAILDTSAALRDAPIFYDNHPIHDVHYCKELQAHLDTSTPVFHTRMQDMFNWDYWHNTHIRNAFENLSPNAKAHLREQLTADDLRHATVSAGDVRLHLSDTNWWRVGTATTGNINLMLHDDED